MNDIVKILMERDGMNQMDAEQAVEEAKERLQEYLADGDYSAAEDICQDEFGLEPDYLMDLM